MVEENLDEMQGSDNGLLIEKKAYRGWDKPYGREDLQDDDLVDEEAVYLDQGMYPNAITISSMDDADLYDWGSQQEQAP
jgi:hypothetical protein